MRQSHRRLAILASVLLLAGMSRCVFHSEVRLVITDETLVDVAELSGAFLSLGATSFQIRRLGNGQYEYAGPSNRLPDLDRVTEDVLATLAARFKALGVSEREPTSDGAMVLPSQLEARLRDLDTNCPWIGLGDRRCALALAELLEPDYPGILAFERALADLPSQLFRQRVRFSLHDLGHGRLAAQVEAIVTDGVWQAIFADDLAVNLNVYFWLDDLRQKADDTLQRFESEMRVYSLALLRRIDNGIFSVVPIEACARPDHLAAYGFERQENRIILDPIVVRPVADSTSTDFVGMLKACFPEDLTDDFPFWKVGVEPPPFLAAGEE
jgi:hypothetical protein